MSVSFASPALPTARRWAQRQQDWPGVGKDREGALGSHRQGGSQARPQVLCLCLPQWLFNSPCLSSQSIFHTAPGVSFLKHKLNPDTAFLKNFPCLPIPLRMSHIPYHGVQIIHSFIHSFTQQIFF